MNMVMLPVDRMDTLRSIRIKLRLNRSDAAELLGVSQKTLGTWEKDSSEISFSNVKKIEDVYNVRRQYIFFGTESSFRELLKKN